MKEFVTKLYSYEYTGSKAHDEKSNDEDDDDANEDIHFDLTQQVEVYEKIDDGSGLKGSDAAVVVVHKKKRVRLIDARVRCRKMNRYRLTPYNYNTII